jgi:hypothetical protein
VNYLERITYIGNYWQASESNNKGTLSAAEITLLLEQGWGDQTSEQAFYMQDKGGAQGSWWG